jgi:hypothetical protein
MARLGNPPPPWDTQPIGQNTLRQDFVATEQWVTFSYNIFTYDYIGWNFFGYTLTNEDTVTVIAQYSQTAWGTGTALKNTGWRMVAVDVSAHIGANLRLEITGGGATDGLYRSWLYVDSCSGTPTTVEVLGGTSSPPIIKCKWETPDDADPDHVTPMTQTLPVLGFLNGTAGEKKIQYWAVATDPEGVGTVSKVYADVYHPEGPPLCGSWKYQKELVAVNKTVVGIPAFQEAWEKGLVKWNEQLYLDADEAYADIMDELLECLADVYMGEKTISSHQPHGEYRVDVQAVDTANVWGDILSNPLMVVGVNALALDFGIVDYGTVDVCTEKWIGGDLDVTTPDKPTVRNIGNTWLQVVVWEDDMGLGQTSGEQGDEWNVTWDARLGVDGQDMYFLPFEPTILPEVLPQCTPEKMDFSIHVVKAEAGSYTGTMVISSIFAPYTGQCAD